MFRILNYFHLYCLSETAIITEDDVKLGFQMRVPGVLLQVTERLLNIPI
jgi:hypothetical protein